MLELNSVDLDELAMALADQTDYDHRWLIDPDSGQVSQGLSHRDHHLPDAPFLNDPPELFERERVLDQEAA